jgi:hypothetical protein
MDESIIQHDFHKALTPPSHVFGYAPLMSSSTALKRFGGTCFDLFFVLRIEIDENFLAS